MTQHGFWRRSSSSRVLAVTTGSSRPLCRKWCEPRLTGDPETAPRASPTCASCRRRRRPRNGCWPCSRRSTRPWPRRRGRRPGRRPRPRAGGMCPARARRPPAPPRATRRPLQPAQRRYATDAVYPSAARSRLVQWSPSVTAATGCRPTDAGRLHLTGDRGHLRRPLACPSRIGELPALSLLEPQPPGAGSPARRRGGGELGQVDQDPLLGATGRRPAAPADDR